MLVGAKGWHEETFPIILHHIHGGIVSQLYLALTLAAPASQLVQEIPFCHFPSTVTIGGLPVPAAFTWVLGIGSSSHAYWARIYFLVVSAVPIRVYFSHTRQKLTNVKIMAAFYLCFYMGMKPDPTVRMCCGGCCRHVKMERNGMTCPTLYLYQFCPSFFLLLPYLPWPLLNIWFFSSMFVVIVS